MLESLIVPMIVTVSTAAAVLGLLFYLVTKDFFLPPFLRHTNVGARQFLAATWILALAGAFLASIGASVVYLPSLAKMLMAPSAFNVFDKLKSLNFSWPARLATLVLIGQATWYCILAFRQYRRFQVQREEIKRALSRAREHKASASAVLVYSHKISRRKRATSQKIPDEMIADMRQIRVLSQEMLSTVSKFGLNREEIQHVSFRVGSISSKQDKSKSPEYSSRLGPLQTLASTAPFTGLLGTVLVVLSILEKSSVGENLSTKQYSHALISAFLTTALGMAVALPAVFAFNYFVDKFKAFGLEVNTVEDEIFGNTSFIERISADNEAQTSF